MKYHIKGARRDDGKDVDFTLTAASEEGARSVAAAMGVLVERMVGEKPWFAQRGIIACCGAALGAAITFGWFRLSPNPAHRTVPTVISPDSPQTAARQSPPAPVVKRRISESDRAELLRLIGRVADRIRAAESDITWPDFPEAIDLQIKAAAVGFRIPPVRYYATTEGASNVIMLELHLPNGSSAIKLECAIAGYLEAFDENKRRQVLSVLDAWTQFVAGL